MNSPVTSAVERETSRAAIVAYFVFQREISRYAFWDFFDSIDQSEKNSVRDMSSALPSNSDIARRNRHFAFVLILLKKAAVATQRYQ
jgi:hypothetical protein